MQHAASLLSCHGFQKHIHHHSSTQELDYNQCVASNKCTSQSGHYCSMSLIVTVSMHGAVFFCLRTNPLVCHVYQTYGHANKTNHSYDYRIKGTCNNVT